MPVTRLPCWHPARIRLLAAIVNQADGGQIILADAGNHAILTLRQGASFEVGTATVAAAAVTASPSSSSVTAAVAASSGAHVTILAGGAGAGFADGPLQSALF